ncbi:MAG: aldo/keto reductase [Steroidobacteraceae bacterium]|jgi:diketogulonate reductase-like aldo/keto reductase
MSNTNSEARGPAIVYGTAWKKAQTARLVRTAIRQGFRGIDTACQPKHYDEGGVGAGVASCLTDGLPRTDLYLQTKFTPVSGQDPASIPYDPGAPLPLQVQQSFGTSLRNLQTDYLDCLLLHSPLATVRQTQEAWRAMESLVAGGQVRQLGISNCYSLDHLTALFDSAHIKPAVVQNRFYADTGYDRAIRAFCKVRQISYQSFWTLSANPHVLAHATIAGLGKKYRRTPAQIFFRYLTQDQVVPLTGTRSEVHMREDLALFEFELTDAERATVDALL